MGESKLSPGGAGLQSGANVPSPATTIDPITGKAHVTATGLTRAQLASQRAAAAINGTPANGTQPPPPNGVSKAVAGVKSSAPHLPSSSWSDDISRAFDRIKVATPTIDEDEVSTFTPQTSLPTRSKASAAAPSAFKAPKLAPPSAPSDGTVVFAPGTRARTTKRLSVNTANGLFTASLDPETMVFFIDDDTVLPGETPKASPGIGESKRIAVPSSSGQATPQASGADGSGPASPASANGATIHAASRLPAPTSAAAAIPQVAVQPPPDAVVSIAGGAADRDVPTGSPMSPKRAGMVGRPAMVSLGAVGGASALRELAGLNTDDANALAVTSETRRGAERSYTSASTTAIHHGAEGKPNERTSLGARPDDGDGDNTTVDTGTVSGDVSRTQTPAGDNSLPQTPASLAIASTTKHGLDPAASTASITAIRNGSEGKNVSHPGSPVSSTAPSHAAEPKSPVPSTTQPASTSDPKSPTSPTSALSAPSANGSSSSDLRTPGHAYRAVGHPASRGLPGTTREVGTYPAPQYDGEATAELAHHNQSGVLHSLAQKVSDKVEGKKPAKEADDEAKHDEDTPPALPEKDSPVSPASPTSASSGVTGAPLSTPSKLGDVQRRKPVPAADAELARSSGNSSPDGQPPVVATVPIADTEADAEAQTPTTAKKTNGFFNRSAANESTTPTTPKSPSSPLQNASAAFAGFGSALRRTASGTLLNTGGGTKERPIISDPLPVPVDKETPGRPSGSFFRSHKRSESAAPNLNPNAEAAARPPTSFFNHSRQASAASTGSARKKGGIFNKLKADFKVIGGRIRNEDKK
ncbi:uncharacterized protein LOC62_02G002811 [Vanrija pseudolonga]|uniref:Uncharacterized protein n=1 Tax=Vanrija pseudolonga TaxID=143232 RepID=A0AAF0Y3C3_9TREE|nr:hypothetical protein LOC62_02G002811 [Vanrija pseudolonga]